MRQGLGTQLRHLIELLDGAVTALYQDVGLNYRPRYTPVLQALVETEPLTLGQIASAAGITQPSATQTVALMVKASILSVEIGPEDSRQRLVRLTTQGRKLLPKLEACWAATSSAANSLDADMPLPLSQILDSAIRALDAQSFGSRIAEARATGIRCLKKNQAAPTSNAAPALNRPVRQANLLESKALRRRPISNL